MTAKKIFSHALWIAGAICLGFLFRMGAMSLISNLKGIKAPATIAHETEQTEETDPEIADVLFENGNLQEAEPLEISLPETDGIIYPKIGDASVPSSAPISLSFIKRIHNQGDLSAFETLDGQIYSPKSVLFSPDGKKVYVNSLEVSKTLVYDATTKERTGIISHRYEQRAGKPVEGAFSHDGKYLWTPYYRFTDDEYSNLPSAVAIVDVAKEKIIKLIETGSVSKNVAVSPLNTYAAVTNWGENTVSLISAKNGNPESFTLDATLAVGKIFTPDVTNGPVNRDRICGACLRAVLFSPDEKILFVGLAGDGGGIAGFELPSKKFLGIIKKSGFGVRDMVLAPDGKTIYISSINQSVFYKTTLASLTKALYDAKGKTVSAPNIFASTPAPGVGRTVKITKDGTYAFMAIHDTSEIVVIDTKTFKIVSRIKTDPFTVGLDISPDGKEIWTTSQGVAGKGGGNAVDIFEVNYR